MIDNSYRRVCLDNNVCKIPLYVQNIRGNTGDCQFDAIRTILNTDDRYETTDVSELRRICATAIATYVDEDTLVVRRDDIFEDRVDEQWMQDMPQNISIPDFRLYWAKSMLRLGEVWGDETTLQLISNAVGAMHPRSTWYLKILLSSSQSTWCVILSSLIP
ncbi:MAG: hypothetical protein EOP45_17260 [Sphingobacteriaceae bacterium]|nr:MAG: hypothetical protein EOP45_17260 [Sphingobacteriaceae bacterium]